MKKILFFPLLFFSFLLVKSQTTINSEPPIHRGCLSSIPFQIEHNGLRHDCREHRFTNNQRALNNEETGLKGYRIRVAVHVLYHPYYSEQNVPLEEIEQQIQILNDDFRRTNADTINTPNEFLDVAADVRIEFLLDTVIRKETSKTDWTAFYSNGARGPDYNLMKFSSTGGSDALDTEQYLNIWIIQMNNGVLGYAQFPESLEEVPSPATDGVVLDHRTFGDDDNFTNYANGRTASHEVGHWLGLFHIWGDGGCLVDDGVDDTPNASSRFDYAEVPNCIGPGDQCGEGNRMVENYMDYSHDECMNLFTEGQAERMRQYLLNDRPNVYEEFSIVSLDFAQDEELIQLDQIINYSATVVGTDSLRWVFEGGTPDTVYNQTEVEVQYSTEGTFDVQLIAYDELDRTYEIFNENAVEVESFVPILEGVTAANPKIFPNPLMSADELLTITTYTDKISSLIITDINGKTQITLDVALERQLSVALSNLESGTYFLRVITDGGSSINRILVL